MEVRNVSQDCEAPPPATKKPFMLKRSGFSGPFPPPSRPPAAKSSEESEIGHSDATPTHTTQPPVSEQPDVMQPLQASETVHVVDKKVSKRLTNVPPPEIQREFDSALNSDSYRVWTGEDGMAVSTKGVMLPPGYQKSSYPEFPWICPVRSCRELFDALFGLGKHFNIVHRASRLNDNLDGTLSELGKYDSAAKGDGVLHGGYAKPPLLVSKKPISLADDPMVEASLQRARERVAKTLGQKQVNLARRKSQPHPSDDEEETAPDSSPPPPSSAHMSTRSRTTGTPREAPLTIPLQALTTAEDNRPYTMWPDDSGQLVHMHGALIPTGYKFDTATDRPWICPIRSCRYLFKARHELGRHFSVRIHRGIGLNDNLDGTFSIVEGGGSNTLDATYVVSRGRRNKPEEMGFRKVPTYPYPKTCVWVPVDSDGEEVHDIPPDSRPVKRQQPERQSRINDKNGAEDLLEAVVGQGKRTRDDGEEEDESYLEEPTSKRRLVTLKVPQQRRAEGSAIVMPGTRPIPQSDLEMEDWEVGDQQIHQAFSAPYLSKQVAIPGHQNLSVQVVSISSGTNHVFSADTSKTRICSLAGGKLKVQFKEGERKQEQGEAFVLGPGGIFIIEAGRECSVMNRCYTDVRLQVTSCGL